MRAVDAVLRGEREARRAPAVSGAGRWRRGLLQAWLLVAPSLACAATDGPGDDRRGYEEAHFHTRSIAVDARAGVPADLVARARQGQLGLPALDLAVPDAVLSSRAALGRKLFFDRRLSLNGTQSCAMCHIPEQGFANNELAIAVGIEGRSVGRNAPTLYNVAFMQVLFHDGRERTLEQQAWQPMLHPNEMANPSIGFVVDMLAALPDYAGLFEAAFDGRGPALETVAQALATYQRLLVSGGSRFDRWYFGADSAALDARERRGFELFTGRARCAACHLVGASHALFTDQRFHNTGVAWRRSERAGADAARVWLYPGVSVTVSAELIRAVGRPPAPDAGRYRVTRNPADRGMFRTPGLRNVALTAPYMHDGALATLAAVVEFYDRGGAPDPQLSPLIGPLGLSAADRADLVAFLEALTGEYRSLVLDAFAAPVGAVGSGRPPATEGRR